MSVNYQIMKNKESIANSNPEIIFSYSMSEDPNERAIAAKYGANLEYLMEDEDVDVLKNVARYSAKYNEKIARYFFESGNMELRTLATLSLSESNLLSDKEIENLETPILRLLIKNRSSLMQIARIHKTGEIKVFMNHELYKMSRYEHLDVTDLRNELNSQPFLLGDYLYKMELDLEDEMEDAYSPMDDYLKKEKEIKEEPEFETEPEKELSLDDLLKKV